MSDTREGPTTDAVLALVVLHGYDPLTEKTTTDKFDERPEDEGTTSPWHRAVALRDSIAGDFPGWLWSIGFNERARDLMSAENMRRWFDSGMDDRQCSTPDCPGDGRYVPPGKGHLTDCLHLRTLRPTRSDQSDLSQQDNPPALREETDRG